MAQRLATEYMKAVLEVTPSELEEFVRLFEDGNFPVKAKVLDRGDREIILFDREDEIPLAFKNMGNYFELAGSYRISDYELAGIMRVALKKFKGFAIVHRIYTNFTMVYHYENGVVTKIAEKIGERERVIYQFRQLASELEALYKCNEAENQIFKLKEEINLLLDSRILHVQHEETVQVIDQKLKELARRLFILEA